ncbi:MAG: PAS domain-containing sensor histidine kinase, partial [Ignavibacteriaceae bacterium]|nr:PAS domain-containing sensor histidine kinase [Ignavibacteriaceae bacterium]
SMFGYTADEIIHKKFTTLLMPPRYAGLFEDKFKKIKQNLTGESVKELFELYAVKNDEEVFPVEIAFTTILQNSKFYSIGLVRDITLSKSTEEDLNKHIEEIQMSRDVIEQHAVEMIELTNKLSESEEKLQQLNADKDKFFSIISHDLRSPFTGLIGFSEILSSEAETMSREEIKKYSTMVSTSVKSVFNLLENLLHWSRLQSGKIDFKPTRLPLQKIAQQILNLYSNNAKFKEIALVNTLSNSLTALADAQMIDTVMRNLVSNALKFTPEGGRITISARRFDDKIEISITDTGIGIPEEEMQKLFQLGVDVKQSVNSAEKGTGLGLLLCKDFIEKNNGLIRAESKPGEGTSFIFSLPAG